MERLATLERPVAYEDDTVAWADAQVALLRAGRLGDIDLENIIEEIDGVAKTARIALASQIVRVIEHLLKLIYSPALDPRHGWIESVLDGRRQIEIILEDSPSLRRTLPTVVERSAPGDARLTARKLAARNALTRDTEAMLLEHRFSVDQVIGDWLPPAR